MHHMYRSVSYLAVVVIGAAVLWGGCFRSRDLRAPAAADAGSDGGAADAGRDAGWDAGRDSGVDVGMRDAGPPALCGPGGYAEFPAAWRACEYPVDCYALPHQTDCCGSIHWLGVRRDRRDDFFVQEAACRALLPTCSCRPQPQEFDDGTVFTGSHEVRAGCEAGVCLSTVGRVEGEACDLGGDQCGAGLSCCDPEPYGWACLSTLRCPPYP
jgi:hypothetical protein